MIRSHGKIDCVDCQGAKSIPSSVRFNDFDTLAQVAESDDLNVPGSCKKHTYVDCAVGGVVRTPNLTRFNSKSSPIPFVDGSEPGPFFPPVRSPLLPAFSRMGDPPASPCPPSEPRVLPVRPEVNHGPGWVPVTKR